MALLKSNHIKLLPILLNTTQKRFSKYVAEIEVKKCYSILGISEDSDQEKIRTAYLDLVKIYHPDSGQPEANSEKFQEIDKAFRILLTKKSKERYSADEVNFEVHAQVFDIKHTAPQHRQYLNYEGIGVGTPFQREKEYGKFRAINAAENVMNHRVNKAQADENAILDKKPQKHNIKTKYGFDRLVEDLIQEAISKGEFNNLAGVGKPLKGLQSTNPYVDYTTHKLNQVLIENGFTPEWIMLQKEIRNDKSMILNTLHVNRQQLGKYPFEDNDVYKWIRTLENCQSMVLEINKKIEKYNLVVPILQKQMLLFDYEKEAEKVAQYGTSNVEVEAVKNTIAKHDSQLHPQNVLSFIESFFIK